MQCVQCNSICQLDFMIKKYRSKIIEYKCKFCFMINKLTPDNLKYFILAYSKKDQNDIIYDTIKYFQKHNKYPKLKKISDDVELLEVSMLEYFIKMQENPPLINYKLFINPQLILENGPIINNNNCNNDDDDECIIVDTELEEKIESPINIKKIKEQELYEYNQLLGFFDNNEKIRMHNLSTEEKTYFSNFKEYANIIACMSEISNDNKKKYNKTVNEFMQYKTLYQTNRLFW